MTERDAQEVVHRILCRSLGLIVGGEKESFRVEVVGDVDPHEDGFVVGIGGKDFDVVVTERPAPEPPEPILDDEMPAGWGREY